MATWRELIVHELWNQSERWNDVIQCTLTEDELDVEFSEGYGAEEGKPFTLWTTKRVYFPIVYDGSEWVGSAPRNPCDEAMRHQGGG